MFCVFTCPLHRFSFISFGMLHFSERSIPRLEQAAFKHSSDLQIYAPRPFFLPVTSMETVSSSDLITRINSLFGFISLHPVQRRIGTFLSILFIPLHIPLHLHIQHHLRIHHILHHIHRNLHTHHNLRNQIHNP